MKKRLLSFFVAIIFIVGVFTPYAKAANESQAKAKSFETKLSAVDHDGKLLIGETLELFKLIEGNDSKEISKWKVGNSSHSLDLEPGRYLLEFARSKTVYQWSLSVKPDIIFNIDDKGQITVENKFIEEGSKKDPTFGKVEGNSLQLVLRKNYPKVKIVPIDATSKKPLRNVYVNLNEHPDNKTEYTSGYAILPYFKNIDDYNYESEVYMHEGKYRAFVLDQDEYVKFRMLNELMPRSGMIEITSDGRVLLNGKEVEDKIVYLEKYEKKSDEKPIDDKTTQSADDQNTNIDDNKDQIVDKDKNTSTDNTDKKDNSNTATDNADSIKDKSDKNISSTNTDDSNKLDPKDNEEKNTASANTKDSKNNNQSKDDKDANDKKNTSQKVVNTSNKLNTKTSKKDDKTKSPDTSDLGLINPLASVIIAGIALASSKKRK